MAQLSVFRVVELALNAAAFLCGIICASALTVTQGEFGGRCVLYGSVLYNRTLSLSSFSRVSLCYFVTGVSVLTAVISCLAVLRGIYICCFSDGQSHRSWFKCSLVLSASVLFFLLVVGCILRVGMDTLCTSIQKSTAVASCQEAQHRPWVHPYHAEKFYDSLYTAEAAAWVNFFFWCLMVVLLILEHVIKSSSQPPQGSDLRTDETAPIIGDGGHRP